MVKQVLEEKLGQAAWFERGEGDASSLHARMSSFARRTSQISSCSPAGTAAQCCWRIARSSRMAAGGNGGGRVSPRGSAPWRTSAVAALAVHADVAGVIVVERPALRRRLALRRLSRPLPRLERFLTFAGRSGRQTATTVRSVALSLKTLITVLLYRVRDGSFLELAAAARGNRSALLLYGMPGVLNIGCSWSRSSGSEC